jgi:VIT1/CCC1 family predicted Fe2+/Mn2+ transporter
MIAEHPSATVIPRAHATPHRTNSTGWLRASVLGANDGLVSISSLLLGVAAAHGSRGDVLVAGVAALAAGAMAMAAGEYVSVHSQKDTESADLAVEREALRVNLPGEHAELTAIYMSRGLDRELAVAVATQLMRFDALGAHARDDIGIVEETRARPVQAALASAASFVVGGAMPLLVTALAPASVLHVAVPASTVVFLAIVGALSARAGGAPIAPSAVRVTVWGALAMAVTAGVGAIFGAVV